jgi:hypothetical protein
MLQPVETGITTRARFNVNERRTIALSFVEGRVVRDLFENGFLDMLNEAKCDVVLFTPAERVPQFKEKWLSKVKAIEFQPIYKISDREQKLLRLRLKILSRFPNLLKHWMRIEKKLYSSDPHYEDLLRKHNCSLLVLTHPTHSFELPVYKAALKLSIPVIGILRSWDNIHKGLRIRPDFLTVWNPVNKQEAIDLLKLDPAQVHITGGSQFDGYFSERVRNSTREEFCEALNLDPRRPIIMLATLGSFLHLYDEQYLVDVLIEAILCGAIPGKPQLVIRLHPTSRLEYMQKYLAHDFVRLSYIAGYIPSIGWTMSRREVEDVGCLMKHSDVVVSPGSTITIETAIFDTPTIVPVFHHYQPDSGVEIFQYHFNTHFGRLRADNLVPFAQNIEDLLREVRTCLSDRGYFAPQRKKLAHDYIHFFDDQSTRRVADFIIAKAHPMRVRAVV